ncbi:MAG TPA: hypothetical protein VIQ77_10365 [Mucilaginibacter sp.]|jgi:hypothetical protein
MRNLHKPLLVVTQTTANLSLPSAKNVVKVTNVNRIFPLIHEQQPFGIVLDYDYLGSETEKILRRLTVNPFYSKMKIYCYKSRAHTKVDGLLTVLGVQQFIYANTAKKPKANIAGRLLSYVFDGVGTNLVDVVN